MIHFSRFSRPCGLHFQTHPDDSGPQLPDAQRGLDGRRQPLLPVGSQQLQRLDVLPFAFTFSPLAFQLPAQFREGLGQLQLGKQPRLL